MNPCRTLSFVLLFALALQSTVSAQTSWYVDVQGTPPGLGTLAQPYTSIQYAHAQASTVDLDTLLVAPGTYVENIVLTKRIVVRATAGPEQTTLRPAVAGPILTLNGPPDEPESITVQGFTITGVFGPPHTGAVRSADGKLVGCIVKGNRGGPYRGVDNAYDIFLVDCTVVDNDVGVECSFITEWMSLRNCIVWGNTTNHFQQGVSGLIIQYCAGGPFATVNDPTNVIGDPLLGDLAEGDYHLRPGSPCIDTGDPTLPNDPDGSRSDMGALSYGASFAICFGDGTQTDHTTLCPCGNVGALGRGCGHSFSALGANLNLTGTPALDDLVLSATGMSPAPFTLFMQHDARDDRVFHDGVLCAGGNLTRLRGRTASGGASMFPDSNWPPDATTTLSQRGGVTIGSGVRRYYSAFFRNASTTFCTPALANVTNGWAVDW